LTTHDVLVIAEGAAAGGVRARAISAGSVLIEQASGPTIAENATWGRCVEGRCVEDRCVNEKRLEIRTFVIFS